MAACAEDTEHLCGDFVIYEIALVRYTEDVSVKYGTGGSRRDEKAALSDTRSAGHCVAASRGATQKRGSQHQPISVVVIDDHDFIRDLTARMLARQIGQFTVLAVGSDAQSAVTICRQFHPDLIILDINLPGESGIEAVPKLRRVSPVTRILLCTAYVSDDRVMEALRCGADGFVEKTNRWTDFVEAIERVAIGERYFCSRDHAELSGETTSICGSAAGSVPITAREQSVLKLIALGATSKEVADQLGISVATVDTHRANLMKKLRIRNIAGLVVFAFRSGLIELPPVG